MQNLLVWWLEKSLVIIKHILGELFYLQHNLLLCLLLLYCNFIFSFMTFLVLHYSVVIAGTFWGGSGGGILLRAPKGLVNIFEMLNNHNKNIIRVQILI